MHAFIVACAVARTVRRERPVSTRSGIAFTLGFRAAILASTLLALTAAAQTPADPSRFGLPADAAEIVSKRALTAKHFQRPDGSFVAIIGAGPLHYQGATGVWQDIDPTFHDDGAGGLISDRAPVQVDAKPNRQISVTRGGVGIRWLTPVNLGPQGGNAVGGTDAKGIQWRWSATGAGLKLNGTVTTPQGPQTYQFQYQLLGVSDFSIDAGGNAVAGGGVVVPHAAIHGADGKAYPASAWQTAPGPHLQFSFDDSGLPPAAYPYIIDPTVYFHLGVCCAEEAGINCPDNAQHACTTDPDCGGVAGGPVCAGAGTDDGQAGAGGTTYGTLSC